MSSLETEPKPSKRLWVLAATGALALHLGGAALAIAHLRGAEDDGTLGANAIEIGVFSSPRVEETDLPPGPDTNASAASPQLNEQKAEVKQTDLPKDKPQESEDPDRLVTENQTNQPKEEETKVAARPTPASSESVAQDDLARQPLNDAQEADTTKAQNLGIGKDKGRLTADWGKQISAYFEQHKRYPKVKKNKTATVKVSLVLNRLGNVVEVGILESSGDAAFDEAAIAMIRRSDPVPRPPAELTDDTFSYSLNVNFNEEAKTPAAAKKARR